MSQLTLTQGQWWVIAAYSTVALAVLLWAVAGCVRSKTARQAGGYALIGIFHWAWPLILLVQTMRIVAWYIAGLFAEAGTR